MASIRNGLRLLLAALVLMASAASAQTYTHTIYIDDDLNPATGCSATFPGGTVTGADAQISLGINAGAAPTVGALTRATCVSGTTFSAPAAIAGNAAIGLNNGVGGADVIEIGTAISNVLENSPSATMGIAATSASGSDVVFGTAFGFSLGQSAITVPSLGAIGLGLLLLAVAGVALVQLRRQRVWLVSLVLLSGVALAANFVVDGLIPDWAGVPQVSDPPNDASNGQSGIDIVAAFAALENGNAFFRIDVRDLENELPLAGSDAFASTEDTVLNVPAAGVLSNDSDPEGQPVTAQIVSQPANGTVVLAANGGFSYTPNADFNGIDVFTYSAFDGQSASVPATVTLTLSAVNDPPSFMLPASPNQNVLQDAGPVTVPNFATAIIAGPSDESAQTLAFTVGNDNNALFAAQPLIAANGTLTFTPAAGQIGTAQVTVTLQDNGGGANTSAAQVFTINVNIVNHAPTFTPPADPAAVMEDAGAQTLPAFVTGITDGDPPVAQTVSFNVTNNSNVALFAVPPAIAADGTLTYAAAADANGTATITFVAMDDGGTAGGGVDTSAPDSFVITVTAVNDTPSFVLPAAPNQNVLQDSGPATVAGFATAISAGPTDEAGQTRSFNVSNDNNALFSAQPTIAANGTLAFTPAVGQIGSAIVTVTLQDNGGGANTSAPQVFTINVNVVNHAPTFTPPADTASLEDAGPQTLAAFVTGITDGDPPVTQTVSFNVTGNTNAALFAVAPTIAADGTLSYTAAADANGTASITFVATDDGGTASGGVDTSAPDTFVISVTAVNDAPSFVAGPDQAVLENAGPQTVNPWATAISAGPADESGQLLAFGVTGNTNAALFSAGPTIAPDGTLTYTPAAGTVGSADITLNLQDDGGAANGGVNTSATQVFTISVNNINDAPVFTVPAAAPTVLEDAGAQVVAAFATGIDDSDPPVTQTLTFNVTGNTNAALFAVAPSIDATTGNLSYTLAANANGSATITVVLMDNGGTAFGGVDTSAPQSFTITATPVNDEPGFTAGPNQNVLENAGAQTINPWATALSAGPADEAGQTLAFNVTGNTNAALFSVTPAVSPTGVLTYTPAANTSGSATITLELQDNGGTANGGDDTSATQSFTISVSDVNAAPSFVAGPDQSINEDAGAQTVNPWATAIDDGDSAVQALTFNVTGNTNAALFSVAPTISPTGVLTYTPAADANGTATITLTLSDDGGTASGGIDTSAPQSFSITVNPVNDAPTFTAIDPPAVNEGSGAQTIANWATFNPGPANEAAQTVLGYTVSAISNPTLFSAAPAVASNGTLTYTPAANQSGTSTFTVTVQDSGGTANGGVDTSTAQTFTVTVNFVNSAPSFVVGPNQIVNEDAGAQTVNPWATALDDGDVSVVQTFTFNVTGNTNAALFSAGPAISPSGALTYTPAANISGTATITLTLSDNGGTANGGADTSAPQNFTITVNAVNDAPSFTAGANQTVFEDAGAQTVNPWATALSAGPADEAAQTLSFTITGNTNAALFSVAPAISPTGVLTYTPAANTGGVATISVVIVDNGGTANGGTDTSAAQNVTITVTGINDEPSFTAGPNQTVNEDAGAQTVNPWATAISAGPPDEAGQTLTFNITANTNAALFSAGPAVSATGVLTYTPTANASGVATITLDVQDNGGIANGGDDTSPTQNFTITVLPVNDPPTATVKSHTTHSAIEFEIVAAAHTGELLEGAADIDDPVGDLTAQFVAGSATPAGAQVTVTNAADGSFRYDPPGGASGAGSFQFRICDDGVPTAPQQCSAATTVTFNITGPELHFVDDSAAAGGDGGLNDPFDSLADLPAGRGTGDRIYLFSGTYATAHSLNADEHLIGQGHSGSSTAHLGVVAVGNGVLDTTPAAGAAPSVTNTLTFGGNNGLLRGVAVNSGGNTGVAAGAVTGITVAETSVTAAAVAINFNGTGAAAGDVVFTSTTSSGGNNGIVLNNLTAAAGDFFDFGTGSLTNNNFASFLATGTLADVRYAGSITKTNAQEIVLLNGVAAATDTGSVLISGNLTCTGCSGIDVINRDTGTITFSGASKVLNTGTNTAVNLDNNDTAQVHFTGGGLDIDTSSGVGFNAVNGATAVTVQGGLNTIDSVSATALNVVNTTIGAPDLTFRSISSGNATAAADPARGIVLNATGVGGLAVTGTGAAGSGGTIQNTSTRGAEFVTVNGVSLETMNFTNAATADFPAAPTGLSLGVNTADNAAIHLQSSSAISLNALSITGSQEHGINGHNVNGFSLTNSVLSGNGNAADEDGIHFYNMVGTNTLTNNTITGSGDDGLNIQNSNAAGSPAPPITTSSIAISGGNANGGVLGSGYLFGIRGSMTTNVTVNGVTVDNTFSGGVVFDTFDTANSTIDAAGLVITNNNDGMQVSAHNGTTGFDIHDNIAGTAGFYTQDFVNINALKSAFSTAGTLQGRINSTELSVADQRPADAVLLFGAGGSNMFISVTNNTFAYRGTQRSMITQGGQDGAVAMHVTATGNNVDVQLDGTNNALNGFETSLIVATPSGSGSSLCADFGGAGALQNVFTHSLGGVMAGGDIRVRQRNTGPQQLPGYGGAGGDTVAVAAYLNGRNTLVSPATAASNDNLFSGGPACTQPIIP